MVDPRKFLETEGTCFTHLLFLVHFAAMDFVVKLITMLLLSSVLTPPDYYYGRAEAPAVADGVVKEDVNLDEPSSSCATHDVRQKIMECVRSTLSPMQKSATSYRAGAMGFWRPKPSNDANADYAYNQPQQSYGIALLYPPGTTQSTYTGDNATVAEWTIDANEVVIMLGCTPPPSRYFSVTPYLMAKKLGERRRLGVLFGGVTAPSEHVRVQAAIGDSISAGRNVYSRIRARGGKEGTNNTTTSSPWSSETVFLMTASRQAGFAAIDALQKCGVEDEIINLAPIPKSLAANHVKKNGGPTTNNNVGGTFSTFSLYLRNEGPDDRAAYDAYQAESNEYWTIAAISVPTTTSDDDDNNNYSTNIQSSFDDLPLIDASGGAIETERKLKPALDRLARAAVVKLRQEVVGANPRRFDESNAPPASDGRACIARNINCGLGNRDTVYSQVRPFVRLSSARAMAIIVGVNHGAAKFATYSNLVVNEVRRRLGLVVLSDNTLANSRGVVEQLLGEARPELYVAIVSRDCATAAALLPTPLDAAPCAEVPTTGWPSAPLDETLSVWERAYADVRTHVGPDVRLMVMPQMITAFDAVSVNPRFVSWG